MTTPDRNEAERFLKALDPSTDRFTFQTFDDNEERNERRKETGQEDPFAKIKHGSLAQHWYTLVKLNEQGAGIFITVNATDFKGRSADNINRVRSVFADLDGAPLEPVIAEGALRPHIITETSPGRWHSYWRIVQKEVATDEKAIDGKITPEQFSAVQRAIAARYGGDSVVQDLPRVMRLPGFIHRKAEPFQSRVVEINDLEPYDWNELCKTFPPPDNGPTTAQRQPPRKKTRFGALNERALANLDKWVPKLFPTAKRTRAGGYRVKSADLGRGLQEDLSITPQGIKYFGVADQGDKRQGRRSPVQLIAEWQHVELPQAAEWLEKMLGSTEQEPPPPEPPEEEAEATDADVEITRLAKFTALEYAQQRKAAAKKLNIPVSMLDKVVQGERERLGLSGADDGKLQGSAVSFEEIEPWPEPVNGVELLGDIATTIRSHVVVSDFSRDISALWTVHTYLIRKFMISPKLSIRSAVKGCGKTTLLDVLSHLVFRALVTGSITKAALFRIIDMWHPTLLIDEVDSFVGDDEELRGMLNNSHRYDGAVVRTVGDEHEPRRFSIYAAVALSGIGGLVDTLADRSVTTDLQRRRPSEPITQLRIGRMEHLHTLQRRITRWVADHQERIADRDPKMPVGVHNREADNWHVLLAVADEAGGDWPERARKAAEQAHIAGANDDASWLELMLGDMRSIFAEKGKKVRDLFGVDQVVISSADLVKALLGLEARPWDEMGKSRKPLSQNRLARMLKPLGIAPKNVGPEDARVRGYILADFKEAFERYLAPEGASQPPIRPERDEIGTSDISKPHSLGNGCADVKCEKPNNDGLLGGCAVAKGGLDENARCDHCGGHASPANPLKPYNWPGRPDGVRLHPGCEAPFHDASPRASEPRPPQATNGSERDMRPCACCGKPGTAADRLRHGHWRPRRPEGDWLHASCIGPWREGGWRRRV